MPAQGLITIGIDSSSHFCGIAIYEDGKYKDSFIREFPGLFTPSKLHDIALAFHEIFKKYKPSTILMEEPIVHNSGKTTKILNLVGGAILGVASLFTQDIRTMHPMTIKKTMGFKSKEEGMEKANKLTGVMCERDDESDAILLVESFISKGVSNGKN